MRELEQRLRQFAGTSKIGKAGRPRRADRLSPPGREIQDRLRRFLQTDITLNVGPNNRGTITLHFFSADDLERLLELMRIPD